MRYFFLAAFACNAALAGAADPTSRAPADLPDMPAAVRLDSAEDFARLRASNPDHYARALRLVTAANALCKPGEPKLQNTDGRDISCGMVLFTSNPPKRRLSFMLDRTRYVAIVTLTADRPTLMHAVETGSGR